MVPRPRLLETGETGARRRSPVVSRARQDNRTGKGGESSEDKKVHKEEEAKRGRSLIPEDWRHRTKENEAPAVPFGP